MDNEQAEEYEENGPMTAREADKLAGDWLSKIRKREKKMAAWRKEAEAAEAAYASSSEKDTAGETLDFNIVFSNIETIVPATYNSTPVPDFRPRHGSNEGQARVLSDIFERSVSSMIDDNVLDREMEMSIQDACLAGLGIVRLRLYADDDVEEVEVPLEVDGVPLIDPLTGEQMTEIEEQPTMTNYRVAYECVPWCDYYEGPARRWADLPWLAYGDEITAEDFKEMCGSREYEGDDGDPLEGMSESAKDSDTVRVFEVWCKKTRKVYVFSESPTKMLRIEDDPFELKGFFPQAEPMTPIRLSRTRTPICPYTAYRKLARELDKIQGRINAIIGGLKVRGFVAGDAKDIASLAEAEDNQLIPIKNLEGLAATGGLKNAIVWWPVDLAISVLNSLYQHREATVAAIRDVTGISDILRGVSDPRETMGAQKIKSSWGSLRIQRLQKLAESQVRSIFALTAEIIANVFPMDQVELITGMPEVQQFADLDFEAQQIDVESDSTIKADIGRARGEMSTFLEGTAKFFQVMAPVVGQAPKAAGPIVEMYAAFARQFNLGRSAETALDQFIEMAKQAGADKKPGPAEEAMKAELQLKMAKLKVEVEQLKKRFQLEEAQMQIDLQKSQAEVKIKRAEVLIKQQEAQLKGEVAGFEAIRDAAEIQIEADQDRPVKIGR